ncbi:hypothetical protein [Streptodolium elevatio]
MAEPIDTRLLAEPTEQSEDLHSDATRITRASLDEHADATAEEQSRTHRWWRPAFLGGASAGAVLLRTNRAAAASVADDVMALQTAASLENLAVNVYTTAAGLPFIQSSQPALRTAPAHPGRARAAALLGRLPPGTPPRPPPPRPRRRAVPRPRTTLPPDSRTPGRRPGSRAAGPEALTAHIPALAALLDSLTATAVTHDRERGDTWPVIATRLHLEPETARRRHVNRRRLVPDLHAQTTRTPARVIQPTPAPAHWPPPGDHCQICLIR